MDTKAKLFFLCGKMAAGINPRERSGLAERRGSAEFSVSEEAPSITFNG
jgi:hypothetical protein